MSRKKERPRRGKRCFSVKNYGFGSWIIFSGKEVTTLKEKDNLSDCGALAASCLHAKADDGFFLRAAFGASAASIPGRAAVIFIRIRSSRSAF
jgi:hypothetical protein